VAGAKNNGRNLKYDIQQGVAFAILAICVTGLVLIALFHP
jgi:hypothetical protein